MAKVTVRTLKKYKDNSEKFTVLTAYDYSTAKYMDEVGVDVILVGDSLAMVALGYKDTMAIGTEEMSIFTKAVVNGAKRAMVVTDMPFMSYNTDVPTALKNIGNMLKIGANAVKIEGCNDYILELIKRCTQSGIPVMGHIGFTPQSKNVIGGHIIQGKTVEAIKDLLLEAQKIQEAGAFSVVLEMVPEEGAKYITENLDIPTISCGAGKYCDSQVMVCDDLFGKYSEFKPKFARQYANMQELIRTSVSKYIADVKNGNYPNSEEVYNLSDEEKKLLQQI